MRYALYIPMATNSHEDTENCPCHPDCGCEEECKKEGNNCPCDDCECYDEDASYTDSYSEDFDEENNTILRGKWIYDGSKTIDDMVECLRREIRLLSDLKNDGWRLKDEVSDDYAFLEREPVNLA